MTRQKLLQFGWEVLIHQPYSPDIAPLDFHLFRSLQNSLNGKNFNSLEDCKRHLEQFFAQKYKKFWEDGINEVAWKMAEGSGTKQWIRCSIKFLVKMENVPFFNLKTEGTFWPTQYFGWWGYSSDESKDPVLMEFSFQWLIGKLVNNVDCLLVLWRKIKQEKRIRQCVGRIEEGCYFISGGQGSLQWDEIWAETWGEMRWTNLVCLRKKPGDLCGWSGK